MVLAEGGVILAANRAAGTLSGCAAGELVGSEAVGRFAATVPLNPETGAGQGRLWPAEWLHAGGRRIAVECSTADIEWEGQPAILLTLRDRSTQAAAEASMRRRLRQQAAIAELGQQALATADLDALLSQAATRVLDALEVEYVSVLQVVLGDVLLVRAGAGLAAARAGGVVIPDGRRTQAIVTLCSADPVVSADLRAETRFQPLPELTERWGLRSGASVAIQGQGVPFGVIAALSTRPHAFDDDDARFLQSAANVLAAAIERRQAEDERERLLAREEEALAEAEINAARFRALADAMPQIVWTANPDGRLDYYNQRWFDYTGLTLAQTEGWGWQPVLHPDDVQRCVERWSAAVASGEPYEIEYRFRRGADGAYRWHLGRALPVHDALGQIVKWFGTCTDIDDQKRLADELRASRDQLRALFAGVHDAIVMRDARGRLVLANEAAAQLYGWPDLHTFLAGSTGEQLSRIRVSDEHGAPLPDAQNPTHLALRGLATADSVLRLRSCETGAERVVEARSAPIVDEHGRVSYVVTTLHDVTAVKHAEEQARAARDELDAILRGVGEGISAIRPDGSFAYINDAGASFVGYDSAEAVLALPASALRANWAILDENGQPFERNALPTQRALRGEHGAHAIMQLVPHDTRPARWAAVSSTPVRDAAGAVRLAVNIFRDITAEREADRQRRRLAAIVDSTDDAVISKTLDGTIQSWNRGAERIYGYRADEVIGRSIALIVPEDRLDELAGILARLAAGERLDHYETCRRRKDGAIIDVSLTISPLHDSAGRVIGAAAIAREISEAKRAEAALRARERQQAAVAELGQQALAGTTIEALMQRAAELIAGALDTPFITISELDAAGEALSVRAATGWGDEPVLGGRTPLQSAAGAGVPLTQAEYALRSDEPVIVEDLATETRFQGAAVLRALGITSGLSVALRSHERSSGAVSAHTRARRQFTQDDVHFLQAMANVLGAAMEQRRVEAQVQSRARQQAAVAALGQRALADDDLQALFDAATAIVGHVLGVENCGVLEADVDGTRLIWRAGIGLDRDLVNAASLESANSSFAGYTLAVGHAVVSDDLATDPRFSISSRAASSGLRCGIATVIPGDRAPFGVLGALTAQPRRFSRDDMHFLDAVAHVLATAIARQRDEAALRASEEQFRRIVTTAQEGIWQIDADGITTYVNQRMAEMLGCSVDDMRGAPVTRFLDAESREIVAASWERRRLGIAERYDLRFVTADGTLRWASLSTNPLFDERGGYAGALAMVADITERRAAEEAVRRSRDELDAILRGIADGLYVQTMAGETLYANQAAARMLGYETAEELVHSPLAMRNDRIQILDEHGEPFPLDALPNRRIWRGESYAEALVRARYADGSERWGIVKAVPLCDDGGAPNAVTVVINDITERRRAEELQRQAENLSRSNAALQEFAYVASHDLQEPLRMVASYTRLLQRRYHGKLDSAADEFIGYAVDGAQRMKQLITDLLAYSRVETQGRPPEPVDLGVALAEAQQNLRFAIDEAGAAIRVGPLPVLLADSTQIGQLFQNLLGNAIKFRGERPPRVNVTARRERDRWLIAVEDNGIGVPPEFAERIFGAFQRLHTRDEYEGSGIGLAVCKKIVERHGGRIWVEPGTEGGARFCLTLPALAEAA